MASEGPAEHRAAGSIQTKRSTPELLETSVGSLSRYADEVVDVLVKAKA